VADPTPLVWAYQAQTDQLRRELLRSVEQAWRSLPGYERVDFDLFVRIVVPEVQAGTRTMASMTDAFLAEYQTMVLEARVAPVGIPPDAVSTTVTRAGATEAEVYRRPEATLRTALAQGRQFDQAVRLGLQRVRAMAETDLQLAKTHTARAVAAGRPGIQGYKRVLSGRSCNLCAAASTRTYNRKLLLPIHGRCDCSVVPIIGDSDRAAELNAEVLQRLQAAGPQYWKRKGFVDPDGNPVDPTTFQGAAAVREHGELGPVLTDPAHEFAHLDDLVA
jgi:hypothetical protein